MMDTRQLLLRDGTVVIDPKLLNIPPDEFLAKYGTYLNTLCLVAKSEAGTAYYQSYNAPKDQQFGEYFSSFAQIASDIGVKTYALMHCNVDYYFSRDPNFQMVRSGGFPIEGYVCPNQDRYWLYLAEIAAEISKYPVDGILLKDALFPRETACFCENCRRLFANANMIDRDFSLERLKKSSGIFSKWIEFRIDAISKMISTIIQRVHQVRKIDVLTELLFDPQTNFFEGSTHHFGQSVDRLRQISSHLLIHLLPWSETLPQTDNEIKEFIANLKPIQDLIQTNRNSLYLWGITEEKLSFAERIKTVLRSQQIFIQEREPLTLLDRRSLHLGLGV